MTSVVSEIHGEITIPDAVVDLETFLDWIDLADLPEKLRVSFINGGVRVDLMEELFSHSRIKSALGIALGAWIEENDLGMYVPDGMLLANKSGDFATTPDAMFLSNAAIETEKVRFMAGKKRGAVATRVVGTPDLVVEIVSPSSEVVDTEWLMSAYHDAGILEYWVIDALRENEFEFDIYKRGRKEYIAGRKQDGWVKSSVLGQSFRLIRKESKKGYPRFKLEVR